MSRTQRLTFVGIAALIAVVAVIVLVAAGSGQDSSAGGGSQAVATPTATPSADGAATQESTPTATPTPRPVPVLRAGSVKRLEFTEGDTIRFEVRNDAAEEVHVHGYDIKQDIEPGTPAEFAFKATITGIFEVELEGSATQLAELRVDPR